MKKFNHLTFHPKNPYLPILFSLSLSSVRNLHLLYPPLRRRSLIPLDSPMSIRIIWIPSAPFMPSITSHLPCITSHLPCIISHHSCFIYQPHLDRTLCLSLKWTGCLFERNTSPTGIECLIDERSSKDLRTRDSFMTMKLKIYESTELMCLYLSNLQSSLYRRLRKGLPLPKEGTRHIQFLCFKINLVNSATSLESKVKQCCLGWLRLIKLRSTRLLYL